ncbi:unnamed protein product [Diamesa hyperborea]
MFKNIFNPEMELFDRRRSSNREVTVVSLPAINEIETVHQSSRINFEIIKTDRAKSSKSNEEKEEKLKNHLKPLNINGVYNFEEQVVVLKFYNEKLEFSLVSISAEYECDRTKIAETEFKDISANSYKYNLAPHGVGKIYQFKANTRKFKPLPLHFEYCVQFIPNRISIRACLRALESISLNRLNDYFENFENEPGVYDTQRFQKYVKFENFEWFNEKIATNEEQMTAIKNIVNCTAFPFPYVIFGPPGTGKTSTLVECVAQILKLKPESKIMITAQSNSACDEIGVRLMKVISPNKIFRLYSPSLLNPKNGVTNPELRRSSNIRSHQNQYPSYEEFYHFNVVIVTLMSSSRLVQVKINNKHFDYMFIDECAAAMEPECLVPILGLGTGFQEITTNLVFLGDHKQLGAVIESDFADKIGLGHSLMERIMTKSKYQNKPHYNVNYVTQLLDNYRSHPAILQFSNVMFYDSMLRCKISAEDQHFTSRWNFLSNKKFPIIFHSSLEPSQKERNGTSSYNDGELRVVDFYVNNLLNSGINGVQIRQIDIGIVSPYKAQLKKLKDAYINMPNIEIGTAEYYQGREKKIIIISTVKSKDGIGFLKSEKRMNVVLTRAKCLLIIVGNPETLQKDQNWNSFIHFCKDNKACVGERFRVKRMTDQEETLVAVFNLNFSNTVREKIQYFKHYLKF